MYPSNVCPYFFVLHTQHKTVSIHHLAYTVLYPSTTITTIIATITTAAAAVVMVLTNYIAV